MAKRFVAALLLLPASALADRPDGVCVEVSADFTPTDNLQIVAWLAKPDGTFVDTVYITNKTGRYGLGNRPGRFDFNTGSPTNDTFPYGRRVMTFPVWAHAHGKTFPQVIAQDDDDNTLSHELKLSSPEHTPPYSRPMLPGEPNFDTGSTATPIFTDKGKFAPNGDTSLYPPRIDIQRRPSTDSLSVELFRTVNPFDAISHATPLGGVPATIVWAAPQFVDNGQYVLFVEASKTYDFNETYNAMTYPSPRDVSYADYGQAWRGQPSVVYSVPITIAATPTQGLTDTYVGYGDPDGASGELRPPDATITTDTPGSGASRFQLVSDNGELFRIRVHARQEIDPTPPGDVSALEAVDVTASGATLSFVAPGDDDTAGTVTGYEVRFRAGSPITQDNFADSMLAVTSVEPVSAGSTQLLKLSGMLPETEYYVGVRAIDNCYNKGTIVTTKIVTSDRMGAEVDACFVATAAYGSMMANDVVALRSFRDSVLAHSVLGELAVETYYTFGPPVAGVVGSSELLRSTARDVLAPLVALARRAL